MKKIIRLRNVERGADVRMEEIKPDFYRVVSIRNHERKIVYCGADCRKATAAFIQEVSRNEKEL